MREAGLLNNRKIVSFSHHVVGEETGFLGEIAILSLTYSPEVTQLPTIQPQTIQLPNFGLDPGEFSVKTIGTVVTVALELGFINSS